MSFDFEKAGSGKRHWSLTVLDYASRAGIIFVVLAFISEHSYRHIERTQDSFQLIAQNPPQSAPTAMALEYLNQAVTFPLCPLRKTCALRGQMPFDNLSLYDEKTGYGVHLEKDTLRSQDLRKAVFSRSNLRKIAISEINLEQSTFTETSLKDAQLLDVDLGCARFINSDLSGSKIYFKNIRGAEFINSNISNATILGTSDKAGLHPETFAAAWVWRGQEPKGLAPKYQTYSICEKPLEDDATVDKESYSKPNTLCVAKNPIKQVQRNVCQVVQANGVVDWIDDYLSSIRDLF